MFFHTRSLADWRLAAAKNPFETFMYCPVKEVREYCIKQFRANHVLDANRKHWASTCLQDHMFGYGSEEDALAGEFLAWCLFFSEHYLRDVLEHVTMIARVYPIYCPTITKVVCGYVKGRMPNYLATYDLYNLFTTAFKPLDCGRYTIVEWHAARRCLERIDYIKDVRFLDHIRAILASHQQGLSSIDCNQGLAVTHETCTAALQTVVSSLEGAIRPPGYGCQEARKDMSLVFSARKPREHPLEDARADAHVFGAPGQGVTCDACYQIQKSWLHAFGE